ncbi:MAG: hypothetical protein Q8R47_05815 [Nanoarchaeota archaeon]|nr:hypothetical protein [Nanoarchaeota archaeon]
MIEESEIIELYVKQRLSGRDISKKTGYALTTIQKVLRKNNVVRNLKKARANLVQKEGYKHPLKRNLDDAKVIFLYTSENISLPKIAKMFNCSLAPLLRILRENKIPIKRLGELNIGNPGYWKGKKRPEMSIKFKGKRASEETREKLRLSHLGQKSTKKGRQYEEIYGIERAKKLKEQLIRSHLGQISVKKGKTFEQLYGKERAKLKREELSLITKQKFLSEDSRKKQSEKIKKFIEKNPEWRELKKKQSKEYHLAHPEFAKSHSERMKEYYSKLENKEAMVKRMKGYYQDHPEALKRMSEVSKRIWNTEEKRDFAKQRRLKQQFPFKHTLPEKLVFDEMELRGIKFEKHKTVLNMCQPDAVIDKMKVAIFVDGDYWHAHPQRYKDKKLTKAQIDKVLRDKEQNELLAKDSWIILRFWESDIKKNVAKCIDKIEEIIRLNHK